MANDSIATSLIDAFNVRNLELWTNRLAPGFAANYPGAPGLNAEQARAYNQAFLTAFPTSGSKSGA